MRAAVLTAICAAALGAGWLSVGVIRDEPGYALGGGSRWSAAVLLVTGWALIAAGTGFALRRPQSRFGPILALAGFAWLAAEWASPGIASASAFTIGLVLGHACPPLVGHAALVYPGRRIQGTAERAVLACAYGGAFIVLGLAPALFFDPSAEGCLSCPRNLALVHGDEAATDLLEHLGVAFGLVWGLLLVVAAGSRLARATGATRGAILAVVVAAIAYLAVVAVSFATDLSAGIGAPDSLSRRLWLAEAGALTLLALAVAWGWVRTRRMRAQVAAVVVDLARSPPPGGLRDALAEVLDDPGLVIAYPLDDGRHVDARGAEVAPTMSGRETTPLVGDGRTVARLLHRPGLLDDAEVAEQVARAARLAVLNERLHADVRAQVERLRASRARIVEAGDAARRQLERDLHDRAQQRLVALSIGLRVMRSELPGGLYQEVGARLDAAEVGLRAATTDLRELAHGIFPAILASEGLAAAVRALAESARVPIAVAGLPPGRLPPAVETTAYAIVVEAARTAGGALTVHGAASDDRLLLELEVVGGAADLDVDALDDRVGALGGRLRLVHGDGSRLAIRAEVPCAS